MAGCPVLQFTKSKALRISAVVALLVALYALAGFVLAPRILRSALMEDIPKTVDATPTVGEIRVNPFLFQLEIKDFSLAARSGEKLLGFHDCSSISSYPRSGIARIHLPSSISTHPP